MTLQTVSRWLSRLLMRTAMQVSPSEREEWAQAMSREVDEIPSEREALMWALGCLRASCHERLKSMRPTNFWAVRWGMALWVALLAVDTLFYAGITLTYKLGLFAEHYPYPQNVPLLEVTPLWDPMLALLSGVVFLWAIVLILRRRRVALQAVVAPFVVSLLLFAIRFGRPESGYLQSLSIAYQKSHYALMWPIGGLALTILICLALWHDRKTPAPH
jgi:hypothetical protein